MSKNNFLLAVTLFLTLPMLAQIVSQRGVAYQYNGKQRRTPLGNVTISYEGNKRSTLSASKNGSFILILEGKQMGDRIGQVKIKKREMMVFNQHAVDEWSVRKEPLMLILCNADEFERQKENLINIGRREAKKKYDRQKAELEALLNASEIKESEYEAALDKAYEELNRLQKNIGEYADLFARIDESEIDTLAQQAMELFNQGEVERAIQKFEEGRYMEKLDKALKNSHQADHLKVVAEQAKEKAAQDSLKALQSLKAQIEAYKLKNEWKKAGELLKGLADRLNTVADCYEYAYFCRSQNMYNESEAYLNHILNLIELYPNKTNESHLWIKGRMLRGKADIYSFTQRLSESEIIYKEAIDIFKNLYNVNSETYGNDYIMTLNNLAVLYKSIGRIKDCESIYKENLRISIQQADNYNVALAYNNLGDLYYFSNNFEESERNFNLAIEKYSHLAEANHSIYDKYLALSKRNLARVKKKTNKTVECEILLKEALKTCRELAKTNPEAYEPDLSSVLIDLGSLYYSIKRYSESDSINQEALEICRRLAQSNPHAYEELLAFALLNQANLYSDTQRLTESEAMYKEALEIHRRQAQANPQAYEPSLALTLNNLAILYVETQRFTESETMFKEALEIRRRLAQAHPQIYEADLAETQVYLGLLRVLQERYTEAITSVEEALEIFRRIAKLNLSRQQYNCRALAIGLLAHIYNNVKSFSKAYRIHQEWLPILKEKYEENPQNLKTDYASALGNQSFSAIFMKRYAESEQLAREGLAVDSTQHWIASNLSASLLFQGKYAEAEKIYRDYKSELKEVFLDDFKQFAESGVIPKKYEADVEKIKQMLSEE